MERTNIYISDTDEQVMQKVLSSISSVIFSEKKYDDILLKRYQEMKEQCNWENILTVRQIMDVPLNILMPHKITKTIASWDLTYRHLYKQTMTSQFQILLW